ncbi:sugar ABC transporter ATP-binding protein [bacterium]|nr:sugar ABC transporter ATP-binding protein [bacterium]RQV93802.1 MAG: sugar ABC transporter ATP-binding protein [bacterium]
MIDKIMLQMFHIRQVFPGVIALDDVDFDLQRGEVHILLGENGAGKSTLIKILSGAYQKTSGLIKLEGVEIDIKNPRHAQTLGISTIYQEFNLVPHLNVYENIFLGREPVSIPGVTNRGEMIRKAEEILDDLGVAIDVHAPVRTLGVAQKQMVEVAKALSMDAKILIMDEPTSTLTDREIQDLFSMIRRLKKKGVSIIFISHRLEEAYDIGDRVTVLRDGRHIGTCDMDQIQKTDLIKMMVNRELKEQYPRIRMQAGEEILRVENVNKKGILKDITFSLHRGEILGITGLMGAGRTELARILFGVDQFDNGQFVFKGKMITIQSPRKAINLGIGFLTEDRKSQGLILKQSLQENICLPSIERFSRWGMMDVQKENLITERYIKELKIKTTGSRQKVKYLSGGNQQKVVMGKWLATQADIFIFDEPTRGIDVGSKVEIYQWMNRLTKNGSGLIMMSSEMPEILGMSDRILVMRHGHIAGEFLPDESAQETILQCALGVKNE